MLKRFLKQHPSVAPRRTAFVRCPLSFVLTFVLTFAALSASAADFSGKVRVAGGGEVSFTNVAATNWVNGELVLKYTTVGGTHGFSLEGPTVADVLVVGGGGAGGSGLDEGKATVKNNKGVGGGGGAGGFVESNVVVLAKGDYSVDVGRGGLPGGDASGAAGESGLESAIVLSGKKVVCALGGGGGGAESDGKSGGSGGGGSRECVTSIITHIGGSGTSGQGKKGGDGTVQTTAGGGGGAGGEGGNGATANVGGAGGDGKSSKIWNGEDAYYAAGGGGGSRTGTGGTGGSGIGGSGGGGLTTAPVLATAGADATGSGGGGGTLINAGAAGGSGIVIVRIAGSLTGDPEPPVSTNLFYDGESHLLVAKSVAWTVWQKQGAGEVEVEKVEGTNVGRYPATVRLRSGFTWAGGGADDVAIEMNIAKAETEITDLRIDSWTEQPAGATLPEPTCTVSVKGVNPQYTYGTDPSGADATKTKPTAAGDYYVFATVTEGANWKAASASYAFSIYSQPKTLFTDSVDVTIGAYVATGSDPKELTNFPYRIELSTSSPVGFDYTRAGATGENICFADELGNILNHAVDKWDPNGVSVVYVRLPLVGNAPQKIYLYWKVAEGKEAPAYDPSPVFDDWKKSEADGFANKPKSEYGMVEVDGKKIDGWVDLPRMSDTSWGATTDPSETGHVVTNGSLRSGREVAYVIYDATTATPLVPQQMPMAEGVYYVLFSAKNPSSGYIEPEPQRIDLRVIDRAPYKDLSDGMGTQTLGGRVLTANGDDGIEPKIGAEEGQAYWQVRTVRASQFVTKTYNPFWTHENDRSVSSDYPYLLAGTAHKLHYIESAEKTNVLWRMTDVRFGNTFGSKLDMPINKCFLPRSATGYGISTYANRTKTNLANEVGQLVMMNVRDATICSPCYTNGIGTIYFDTVNASPNDAGAEFMHLVLEVATETKDHLPPTDENAGEDLENITEAEWKPVTMTPLKCTDGVFAPDPDTDDLALSIMKGGTDRNFYRVYAKLNQSGTLRFRLRRLGQSRDGVGSEYGHFILIDNILVSFPMSTATAEPYGVYHPEKKGKQALGWESAMANVSFPSYADNEIFARAKPVTNMVSGLSADPATFIQLSKFHYQWHYLNQASNGWNSVDLRPQANFVAEQKLDIPNEPGDVEFWFETYTKIPFFDYIDYSGAGLKLGGLYTEEVGMQYYPENALEGGRCFVRLRNGQSEWNGVSVVLQGAGTASGAYAMELIGDHLWRGLVQVPTNVQGAVNFSFQGEQRWEAGATTYAESGTTWYPTEAVTNRMPARGQATIGGKPLPFRADGATGFYEFQFNDEDGSFSIGHAEYQDFNDWHDAYTTNGTFVGTAVLTSGVSIAAMVTTNAHMKTWTTLDVDNDNWQESFYLSNYEDTGYPKNVLFNKPHKMPHQWNGENGMFVDAMLTGTSTTDRQKNSGIGWKMQGYGVGSLSYTSSDVPNGLDQVSFMARLEQTPTFEDFSYCYADGMMATNDYTFFVPAILSCSSSDGKCQDFAPGASMSLVGFYKPMVGCYEFRVSRDDNANLRFAIYKWYRQGYQMMCDRIATHLYSSATFWNTEGTLKPKMYGMFISVGTDEANKTAIVGGLTTAADAPNSSYVGSSYKYRAIRAVDETPNRHTAGTAGVLMSSCNGRFLTVRRYSQHVPATLIASYRKDPSTADREAGSMMTGWYDNNTVINAFPGMRDATADLEAMEKFWAYAPGRIEFYRAPDYQYTPPAVGFRPPADLGQTIDVYLKSSRAGSSSSDDASWRLFKSQPLTSYGWQTFSMTIRTNQSCHVMLKPGNAPTDVTIGAKPNGNSTTGGIRLTAWNGADMVNPPDDDFIYTQAAVTTNMEFRTQVLDPVGKTNVTVVTTNKYCKLQPARAQSTKPLSIRSPMLRHGVGMIGFSYTDLHTNAEIWVQLCTNSVRGNLTGSDGLNLSIREGTGPREWETVRKFTYDELKASDSQQHFIGAHDRIGKPLEGVLRIVVPTHVIDAAAARTQTDPEYGSITITDVVVQDEPALDTYSWLGWNIRTLGDPTDQERRMYLPDADAGAKGGRSSGLNNSTTDGILPGHDPSEYSVVNPTVQSPTFRNGSIGYVRFRARVYDNSGVVGEPATVSLYGVMDAGEGEWGAPITNFTVTSSRFTEFEYRAAFKRFATIRLAVDGVIEGTGKPARVLLDEVIVSEKTESSVGFAYARPFRSHLDEDVPLADATVLGMDEQPLVDESWGVQAKLKLDQFDQDIDVGRGFRVTLRTFVGETPWGYESWCTNRDASEEVDLKQMGDAKDLIFRSTVENPDTVMKPVRTPNTTVQYMLTAYYYLKNDPEEHPCRIAVVNEEGSGWTNPAWYAPVNKNAGKGDPVPYTILDGMSPGRAWINEVNYNDGPKGENGNVKIVTNQFIEIAVPWGVDMKDWYVMLTDINLKQVKLATFGLNGVPNLKKSGEHSGDYGFLVLESPGTKKAGGIKDGQTGQPIADGTWTSASLSSTFSSGELQYSQPYQIELYRPSGILEHQFVIAGTNEWRLPPEYFKSFGYKYEGTNLLHDLDVAMPSPRRFLAGEDLSRKPSAKTTFASFGVTGGAHGEEGGWSDDMKFTPGRLNEGQNALTGWYLRPNGGSVWIYATVDEASRGNVTQRIGDDTSQDTLVIVAAESSTNIVYDVKPWFAVEAVGVNDAGKTNYVFSGTGQGATFNLNNVTETIHVVAREGIDPKLVEGGLKPDDPYTPAVLRWLRDGSLNGRFKHPEGPIQNATYLGLHEGATNCVIGVKGMYWFDIDPTEGGWWMRGGFVDMGLVNRMRKFNAGSKVPYQNAQLGVKLYWSNEVSQVVHAPERLQGLNNEKSDDLSTYSTWTSVTFKVEAELANGMEHNVGYLPFRWFVFGPDSFVKPEDAATLGRPAFTTKIEILDPFSLESPGYSYGWRDYKGKPIFLRWNINEQLNPSGVEMLKADSTYEGSPLFE